MICHDQYNSEEEQIVIGRVGYYCGSVHLTPEMAWITDNAFFVYYSQPNLVRDYINHLIKWPEFGGTAICRLSTCYFWYAGLSKASSSSAIIRTKSYRRQAGNAYGVLRRTGSQYQARQHTRRKSPESLAERRPSA